ncbi:MAG: DUF3422 domain-containing protein [Comamonadaceae bacterium]|nr:DUF3422 domain-containing protein [Comamonadaceae bacterium]
MASCRRPPRPRTSVATSAAVRLKWERHGEFSGYLFIVPGARRAALRRAGRGAAARGLAGRHPRPHGGRRARRTSCPARPSRRTPPTWPQHFAGHTVAGSRIAEGAASVYTDFRIHDDGFSRFLVFDRQPHARPGRAHAAAPDRDRGLPHAGAAGAAHRAPADAAHAGHRTRAGRRSPTASRLGGGDDEAAAARADAAGGRGRKRPGRQPVPLRRLPAPTTNW